MQNKIKSMNNPNKTCKVILSGLIILLAITTCCLTPSFTEAARTQDQASSNFDVTTTEASSSSFIEDPSNSDTTSDDGDDDTCFRCYDAVKMAQNKIAIQMDLVNKQSKLIRQKHKAATAAAAAAAASSQRKPKQPRQRGENLTQSDSPAPAIGRIRSLENQQIVVSRLRVARSTYSESPELPGQEFIGSGARNQVPKNSKDPALKQLKHKQEQQLNETCKSLSQVQQCLNRITKECVGNLQFHSQEVFSNQWMSRLNCNAPTLKPFQLLTRTIPKIQESMEKVPIPRPISSPEEIKKKLDGLFGGRNRGPMGVMLTPTMTSFAKQKFNSISERGQQQQLDGASADDDFLSSKGRLLFSPQQILAERSGRSHLFSGMTSQLLLVPAFLILIVLFVTITCRYLKPTRV